MRPVVAGLLPGRDRGRGRGDPASGEDGPPAAVAAGPCGGVPYPAAPARRPFRAGGFRSAGCRGRGHGRHAGLPFPRRAAGQARRIAQRLLEGGSAFEPASGRRVGQPDAVSGRNHDVVPLLPRKIGAAAPGLVRRGPAAARSPGPGHGPRGVRTPGRKGAFRGPFTSGDFLPVRPLAPGAVAARGDAPLPRRPLDADGSA
ncbi:hypothetical protein DSECCO2_479790 [anaerobic digester metagenome]